MTLSEYLVESAKRKFTWGAHDCCTFPGDWVLHNVGFDPVKRWRGRYNSEDGAVNFIKSAGGICELWETGIGDILPLTDEPTAGDVGIIETLGGDIGGIFTGKRWAFLSDRGVHYVSVDPGNVIAAWCVNG